MPNLPFEVTFRPAPRGAVVFVAMRDNLAITSVKYGIGDADKRLKTAKACSVDERLNDGDDLPVEVVEMALDRAELQAQVAIDEAGADEGESESLQRSSYADDTLLIELTWNTKAKHADYTILDRETGLLTRDVLADTPIGEIVIPKCATDGIVTSGCGGGGAVLVPTHRDKAGEDEDQLRTEIKSFIQRYVQLPSESIAIAIEYVLLTWVHDLFDECPYQAFRTADAGRGKSRALETVGSLCYRPLFVGGGSSSAATLRMQDVFGGTLLADEFDQNANTELGADLNRILNQGFQRNRPLIKCDGENNEPRPFRCYGPKLFALRKQLGDDATESRTISLDMRQRTDMSVPISLPRAKFNRQALAIRNKLLGWWCKYWGAFEIDLSLADPSLEDRANQIGLPLLTVARSETARGHIIAALKEQQNTLAASRADSQAGETFEVIIALYGPGSSRTCGPNARSGHNGKGDGCSGSWSCCSTKQRSPPIFVWSPPSAIY